MTETEHATARRKLAAVWARYGFVPFHDDIHLLSCHLQRPQDLLAERTEEVTVPGTAWRGSTGNW